MTFSEKVLNLTKQIPKGKITTYKLIANKLNTKAYQAVGNALNKNEYPIIIPCHRVVNSNGSIGGYAKGIKQKIRILNSEGIAVKNGKIDNFNKHIHTFKKAKKYQK